MIHTYYEPNYCPYKDDCADYPEKCHTCKHNKKPHRYEPRITWFEDLGGLFYHEH